MDVAFNKKTGEFVNAFKVYDDGSYQNLDPKEWIAPTDEIYNWNELKKIGINEVPVTPRRHSIKKINGELKIIRSPCFAKKKDHPGKTKSGGESKEHKMIKNFIYEKIINDDIEFVYSKMIGKNKKNNSIKLSELPIDKYNCQVLEQSIQSSFRTRADILIPFTNRHSLFGNGIIIEVQLSQQDEKKTIDRNILRGTQGYSVAWIFKKDIEEIESCIFLKNNRIKLNPFIGILDNDFPKKIENLVEEQCRYLNNKINEFEKFNSNVILEHKKISDNIFKNIKWEEDEVKEKMIETHERLDAIENEFELKIDNKINEFENKWDDINKNINGVSVKVIGELEVCNSKRTKEILDKIDNNYKEEIKKLEDNWSDIKKRINDTIDNLIDFNMNSHFEKVYEKDIMNKLNIKVEEILNDGIKNKVSDMINSKFQDNLNMLINNYISKLDLSKIFNDANKIIKTKTCPKCGKQMHIGKAMAGFNWYCERFPYCDGFIKGCDKDGKG